MGFTTKVSKRGRERMHAVCGLLMHSSLAVTTDGLPLGIAAAKFWTRKKFKGTNALKRKINPTRVPIEGKVRRPQRRRQVAAAERAPVMGASPLARGCGEGRSGHMDSAIADLSLQQG